MNTLIHSKSLIFLTGILLSFFLTQIAEAQEGINQLDADGNKHGIWKKTEQGRLIYTGQFEHGTPYGKFTYYYKEGGVKAITTFSGEGKVAQTTMYHNNGRKMGEGRYINQEKDGVWLYYNPDEKLLAQEEYDMGIKDGMWITYYENGQASEEIPYKNGKREGIWKQYYQDGSLKSRVIYVDDRLEGLAQFYYADGKVMMSGTYVNSLKDGIWILFKEDGRTATREEYSKGYLVKTEEVEDFQNIKVIREDEEENEYIPGRKPPHDPEKMKKEER